MAFTLVSVLAFTRQRNGVGDIARSCHSQNASQKATTKVNERRLAKEAKERKKRSTEESIGTSPFTSKHEQETANKKQRNRAAHDAIAAAAAAAAAAPQAEDPDTVDDPD